MKRFFALQLAVGFFASAASSQSLPLETFKAVTSGATPIEFAKAYRDSIGHYQNGKVSIGEDLMFGWSSLGGNSNSWFQTPTLDYSVRTNQVFFGQSLSHTWYFTDSTVQVVALEDIKGSHLQDWMEPRHTTITEAATLGLDRWGVVKWDGDSYTGTQATDPEYAHLPVTFGKIEAKDDLGRPTRIVANDRTNLYVYEGTNWFPAQVESFMGEITLRHKYATVRAGGPNWAKTHGGFTPSMFLDDTIARDVFVWTNSAMYSVLNSGKFYLNSQDTHKESNLGLLFAVGFLALTSAAGWWWKSRTSKT
jgi:hypothetical protein